MAGLRTVSKGTFNRLTFTIALLFAVVANVTTHAVGIAWGFRVEPAGTAGFSCSS